VRDWTRVVEVTLAGAKSPDILRLADEQSRRLVQAIEANPRISELAVNPLLLTVIALVHRYRLRCPNGRSELYEEAVEVLLAGGMKPRAWRPRRRWPGAVGCGRPSLTP